MVSSSGFMGLCLVGLAYKCVGGWLSLGSFKLFFFFFGLLRKRFFNCFFLLIYSNREREEKERHMERDEREKCAELRYVTTLLAVWGYRLRWSILKWSIKLNIV